MSQDSLLLERSAILRILDANANRAVEGLRVIEEYLRFVLEDRYLAGAYKQFRHDLSKALELIPLAERFSARDTQGDIGTESSATDEYQRKSARDVALASQKRLEQSLRCLEEYAKPLFADVAKTVEQLRYGAYTLARAVENTAASRERLRDARLYVLIDGRASPEQCADLSRVLLQAGAHVLQLRDKRLSDRALLMRARQLRELTRRAGALLIVNDRPDLAVLSDADGVHVGQDELTVKDARALIGPDRLIGVSTHSMEQARQAVLDGANYIGCGPTFPSATKQFTEFVGCQLLQRIASEISLPAFAIGGITLENLGEVMASGVRRIAVSGAILESRDPAQAVTQFLEQLK